AFRRRAGDPGWCRRRLLGPGGAASPGREFLALLPSGPAAVRTLPVRGTRPSTPRVDDPCPRPPPSDGVRSRWSGFRVQGTADSPPSANGRAQRSRVSPSHAEGSPAVSTTLTTRMGLAVPSVADASRRLPSTALPAESVK